MKLEQLIKEIKTKNSFLCVGLDTNIEKLPKHLPKNAQGVLEFNKLIIDATKNYCVSYKINTAFYEAMGWQGWKVMEETFAYMPDNVFKIADAKRGDIGNTSKQYADAFFKNINADAVTLAPYMGNDSLEPFFNYKGKWGIILALTSNKGSADYEQQQIDGRYLFEHVIENSKKLGSPENTMFVVGATKPQEFELIRKIAPDNFLLVPGVGAQGGNLHDVVKYGKNKNIGLLINASRSIIYASDEADFAEAANLEAQKICIEMAPYCK
ncbi:MAG: orotidine-5'-phosphate decarboxylase [Bacteroidia bacterium]